SEPYCPTTQVQFLWRKQLRRLRSLPSVQSTAKYTVLPREVNMLHWAAERTRRPRRLQDSQMPRLAPSCYLHVPSPAAHTPMNLRHRPFSPFHSSTRQTACD